MSALRPTAILLLALSACSDSSNHQDYEPTCVFAGSCTIAGSDHSQCFERVMYSCEDHDVANDYKASCEALPGTYSKDHCPDTPWGCCTPESGDLIKLACTTAGESQCIYGNFTGTTSQQSCELGGGTFYASGIPPTPPLCQ